MARLSKGCSISLAVAGVALLLAAPWLFQVSQAVLDAKKAGLLDQEKTEKYQVGRENNLKAIHKALLQAADSDGGFPVADKWMDAALLRLKTGDLSEEEARAKLRLPGATDGTYGYALNKAVSGKHPDDFKGKPDTVLVFESTGSKWNASGDPAGIKPGGKSITLKGEIVGQ